MLRLQTILIVTLLLGGCATSQTMTGGTDSLQHLEDLNRGSSVEKAKQLNSIREQALEETALSIGAQAGLAWRAKQINQELSNNQPNLEQAFNFNLLLLPHNVLPPVLSEGDNSLNLADDNTIRIADRTYQIQSQARFVTSPPTWRDYLWLHYKQPDPPDASLLPQNMLEKTIWKKYVDIGWQNGINQADMIFGTNLARLKRDYTGMILYRKLLANQMVSAPFVARTDLGVTGGGSDLRINDQVLRITALPELQANPKQWKPVIQETQ